VHEEQRAVCDYEGSDYQERFWDHGEREYEDRVEAIALHRLLPESGDRLLDIGAGAGRNVPRYGKFQQIVLLDYARTQLKIAQQRLGESERYLYVAADAYRLPFAPDVFDAAVMVRTLHHMVDPQTVIHQVRGVIAPNARFILEFANKRNIKAILRWLFRRQAWNPFSPEPIEFATLNFDFHPREVQRWLEVAQFRIERKLTVSHLRIGILKRFVPVGILVALDSLFQWSGALWQLTPSVFFQSRALGEGRLLGEGVFWRCPACSSLRMTENQNGVHCGECGAIWGLRDGIFDFKEPLVDP
jgi:ubiquinone/menaquinone biosynthesis C-methylase UbiE